MATGIPSQKVILCGEYGVGKSSLFRRFIDNSFTEHSGPRSTIGLDHFARTFNQDGRQIRVELWDTAGIERFATLSASYFKNCAAAILCYAINDRDSFSLLSQHLLEIVMHTDAAQVFLCGNKCDLVDAEEITMQHIEEFKVQCDTVISASYRISCKTGDGINEMLHDISRHLVRNAKQPIDRDLLPTRLLHEDDYMDKDKSACCSNSVT